MRPSASFWEFFSKIKDIEWVYKARWPSSRAGIRGGRAPVGAGSVRRTSAFRSRDGVSTGNVAYLVSRFPAPCCPPSRSVRHQAWPG